MAADIGLVCSPECVLGAAGHVAVAKRGSNQRRNGFFGCEQRDHYQRPDGQDHHTLFPGGQRSKEVWLDRTFAAQATPTNQPPAQVAAPAPAPKPAAAAAAKPPVQPPPVKPKPPKHWNLTVDLGTDLEFSQTRRELFYGHVKWTYGKDRLRGIVDYLANYGKNGGIVSANDMTGSVRVEEDLNKFKRVFFFDAAGAGYNEIRKIDLSYDDSLGMGYKLVTLTNLIVSGDVGANYQKQHFSDGTSKDYEAVRLGEQMTWKISRKLVWDQKFEFYSRVSGIGDYRLRLESNLRYLLSNNLNLNFTTIDQFDTQPAPGITRNDLLLRATVGIKF